jgi:hypothetical protein
VSPRRILVLAAAAAIPAALGVTSCGGGASQPVADAAAPPPDGGPITADAGTMADAASDAADAGDVADAAGAGAGEAGPPLPSWSAEPFPEKRSPMPKKDAWASAPLVALDRWARDELFRSWTRQQGYYKCEARRLNEWIRIYCSDDAGGIMLIGGNADGFSVPGDGSCVFPVRRGDRRVIEVYDADTTVNAHTTEPISRQPRPGLVISEQWLAGDERPTLVASDYRARPR